ncbi:histidine kinase [Spirosoma sp. BT702]|uniref:Histidine kinase n=1 Tax=Spirosoma profusum TaxID=2771354 RepID=A0A927AU04_9BACT|nr:histidine kinase [Spirosoma profusum]MBD2701772.1 histidine kinase [Spirosoma profusum]
MNGLSVELKNLTPNWLGRHLLFWLTVNTGLSVAHSMSISRFWENVQTTYLFLPYNMILVYAALYWVLTPILQNQYRPFVYRLLIYLIGGWIFTYLYRAFVLIPFRTGKLALFPTYHEIFTLGAWIIGLVVVGVAVGVKLYRFWYQREQANQRLIRETLTVELQVLKAQIHPHFLFNTLNNLYSLTLRQSPLAPDMVLKLSGLLHYMIHECNVPTVLLAKEIDFLRNYIDLEKLRYGSRLTVSITIQGEMGSTSIAPLLLIPFVENAFKHGSAKQIGSAHIEFVIKLTDNQLTFRLENSRDKQAISDDYSGLGLTNARKRLELLYPNTHTLIIRPEAERFVVELTILLRPEWNRSTLQTIDY